MAPAFLFIVDLSLASVQTGFFATIVESLKEIFTKELFPNIDRTKIGLITYDSHVNFYKLNTNGGATQMFSIADSEMFLPAPVNYINK